MSILSRAGYPKYNYLEPERLTVDQARQRRVLSELSKQRKALEADSLRLSPANKFHLNRLKDFESKFSGELEARARHVDRLRKRLADDPDNRSVVRAHRVAMFGLFQLRQRRSALLQRAASEKRRNALRGASMSANRNFFSPYLLNPRTVHGTEARVVTSATSRRMFHNPLLAFPCVQRLVRKEVLFARGHGGRGHRGKRRFNPLSHIGC